MIEKKRITSKLLNEAPEYGSSFSRGLEIPFGKYSLILISGTASVDENGETFKPGDFTSQIKRTYDNLTDLLNSAGVNWHDVIRTRCYLRDMDRDYKEFNKYRTKFYDSIPLKPYPASLCIEARLCRPDLLVEIELTAIKAP